MSNNHIYLQMRCSILLLISVCCLSINWNLIGKERLNMLRNRRFLRIQDHSQISRFLYITEEMKITAPWNAPAFVWNFAWQLHQKLIPWLHMFDRCFAEDSSYNLAILWCKAISGNRLGSRLWDEAIAFDLLPPIFRWIVQFPLCWLYPNLHHQNVALRTAFLDSALKSELSSSSNDTLLTSTPSPSCKYARVIVLGSGHDTRSLRFANMKSIINTVDLQPEFWEIDLPSVIRTRRLMLERFVERRKRRLNLMHSKDDVTIVPSVVGVDLNKLDEVRSALVDILSRGGCGKVIFVVEAVLMYLHSDVVQPLLSLCVDSAKIAANGAPIDVALLFADRFPGVCDGGEVSSAAAAMMTSEEERAAVETFLRPTGLTLKKWMPKPGRARHMGVAILSESKPTSDA